MRPAGTDGNPVADADAVTDTETGADAVADAVADTHPVTDTDTVADPVTGALTDPDPVAVGGRGRVEVAGGRSVAPWLSKNPDGLRVVTCLVPRPSLFSVLLVGALVLAGLGLWWVRGAPERRLAAAEERWGASILAGDLVFQDLDCGLRCQLIRDVTASPYAHVGVVLEEDGARVVWEALGPVGPTPLAAWMDRGRGRRVAVYRPAGELAGRLPDIAREVRAMGGLPYDGDYLWDDERIYCSELYAKAVSRALGRPTFVPRSLGPGGFGQFAQVVRRMSKGRLTEQTPLVSPADLVRSGRLERVVDELAPPR